MAEGSTSSAGQAAGSAPAGQTAQSAPVTATPTAETTGETKAEVKAESTVQETTEPVTEKQKHKFADRLIKTFPDRKFEKDDDYDTALNEHLDELEGYKERGTTANKKLIALFESEPQVGNLVRDMVNGATFREALARHISPDELTAVEGDPDYEGWTKNKTEREKRLEERKKRESDRDTNLTASQKEIEAFAKENNMDDKAAEEFLSQIDSMLEEFNSGRVTKDNLARVQRMLNYEKDIEKAKEDSRIAGRNENIVAKKETEQPAGDGLPRPSKTSTEVNPRKNEPTYMDNLLTQVKKRQVL